MKLHKWPKGNTVFSPYLVFTLQSLHPAKNTTFVSSSSTFNTILSSPQPTNPIKTHHHEPPKSTTVTTTTTMKISSKSILSPARAGGRDPPSSLSTSLSRRLKNSGSIKGGASPAMFPTTAAKKRGSFENPEPSSPKVTCIGQVRVKTKKKQAKKLRTLSRRHTAGEVSFRQHTHNQESWPPPAERTNPKWVHLPVTICDALRAFGSEFSCLFPCRKEEKPAAADDNNNHHRHGSCGAVFARWMVAVQDGGGEERDIELVVEKEEEEEEESFKKARRHVFEDLEIINGGIEGESRASICVPPKNALLLMRCRSDPVKMEALTTTRSWGSTIGRNDEEIVEETMVDLKECEEDLQMGKKEIMGLDQDHENVQENEAFQDQDHENVQENEAFQDQDHENVQENEAFQDQEHGNVQKDEAFQDQDHENEVVQDNVQEDEVFQDHDNVEVFQDSVQENEGFQDQDHENVQEDEAFQDQEHYYEKQDEVFQDQDHENGQQNEVFQYQDHENGQQTEEESLYLGFLFEEIMNQDDEIQENEEPEEIRKVVSTMVTELAEISKTHEEKMVNNGVLERESEVREEREVLPDCLLMMMYEPKLSMEVSKETWVCSQDFIRRQSNKRKPPPPPQTAAPAVKQDVGDESRVSVGVSATTDYDLMRVAAGGYAAALQHPARSSCSFPAAPSMAAMLEQKLADAMGYEPFVLTRCKSEPMKTAAAKLLPDSCVWENRSRSKRLSGVAFGVGAAGLGF